MFVFEDWLYHNGEEEHNHVGQKENPVSITVVVESRILEEPLLVGIKIIPVVNKLGSFVHLFFFLDQAHSKLENQEE